MRNLVRPVVAAAVLALFVGSVRADDNLKAVVEKAIKAHGGEEKLSKFQASKIKAKGSMSAMGVDIDFNAEAASQLPDKIRVDLKLEIMGQAINVIQVYDGKKGWVSAQGQLMELEGDQLDELKDQAFGGYVESLVPLIKDKSIKLEPVGEEKVDGKPTVGIKVSAKGHRDIKLFFDKESGMLVKSQSRAKDPAMQEVDAETFYKDYKDVDGVKQPMKLLVKHDGKKYLEAQVTEAKLFEKLDDTTFAKP